MFFCFFFHYHLVNSSYLWRRRNVSRRFSRFLFNLYEKWGDKQKTVKNAVLYVYIVQSLDINGRAQHCAMCTHVFNVYTNIISAKRFIFFFSPLLLLFSLFSIYVIFSSHCTPLFLVIRFPPQAEDLFDTLMLFLQKKKNG